MSQEMSGQEPSHLERVLLFHIRASGLPEPEREFKFHPKRKWRFDFAYPALKVAIEVEGGVWANGRHSRGSGYVGDCEKYNEAALMGWRVLRFPDKLIESGLAVRQVKRALGGEDV